MMIILMSTDPDNCRRLVRVATGHAPDGKLQWVELTGEEDLWVLTGIDNQSRLSQLLDQLEADFSEDFAPQEVLKALERLYDLGLVWLRPG
jgi:hypothetical protein